MKVLNTRREIDRAGFVGGHRDSLDRKQNRSRCRIRIRKYARRQTKWASSCEGGITHGETLRFSAFHSAEASCETHEQMLLTVFDSQGNVVVQQSWTTNPNQTFHFDLNADQLPQSSFDNNGRARTRRAAQPIPAGSTLVESPVADAWSPERCSTTTLRQTLVHIAGTPITECRKAK